MIQYQTGDITPLLQIHARPWKFYLPWPTANTYDSPNQLIREDNKAAGKTWTWESDDSDNILNRMDYDNYCWEYRFAAQVIRPIWGEKAAKTANFEEYLKAPKTAK